MKNFTAIWMMAATLAGCASDAETVNRPSQIPEAVLVKKSESAVAAWKATTDTWRRVNTGMISGAEPVCRALTDIRNAMNRDKLSFRDIGTSREIFGSIHSYHDCKPE